MDKNNRYLQNKFSEFGDFFLFAVWTQHDFFFAFEGNVFPGIFKLSSHDVTNTLIVNFVVYLGNHTLSKGMVVLGYLNHRRPIQDFCRRGANPATGATNI